MSLAYGCTLFRKTFEDYRGRRRRTFNLQAAESIGKAFLAKSVDLPGQDLESLVKSIISITCCRTLDGGPGLKVLIVDP